MDADGEVLAVHEGARTVEGFQATAKGAQHYVELRGIKDPTPEQKVELFLAELELGKLDLAKATARKGELTGLTPEQEGKISNAMTDLEVMDALEKAQPRSQAEVEKIKAELGARFHGMFKEGRRPAGDQPSQAFYSLILDWAEHEKDAATFEEALTALRDRFGKLPGAEKFFQQQEERLARLKSK